MVFLRKNLWELLDARVLHGSGYVPGSTSQKLPVPVPVPVLQHWDRY